MPFSRQPPEAHCVCSVGAAPALCCITLLAVLAVVAGIAQSKVPLPCARRQHCAAAVLRRAKGLERNAVHGLVLRRQKAPSKTRFVDGQTRTLTQKPAQTTQGIVGPESGGLGLLSDASAGTHHLSVCSSLTARATPNTNHIEASRCSFSSSRCRN